MSQHQDVQLAKEASLILENPAFQEAMKRLHAEIRSSWLQCPVADDKAQRLYLITAKLAEKFEAHLNGMIQSGKMAQHKLERLNIDDLREENGLRRMIRKVVA